MAAGHPRGDYGRLLTSVYPFLRTFYISFFDNSPVRRTFDFVGLDNYMALTRDSNVDATLTFTLFFTVTSVVLQVVFVVVSPDSPAAQQDFAKKRGWQFIMYSAEGTTFTMDMGFQTEGGEFMSGFQPGVSVLHKNEDGTIVRVSKDAFGPGDLYCGVWHLFNLLPDGWGDWGPKFDYSSSKN